MAKVLSTTTPMAKKIALSLSGSGHLLIYQLGVCKVLIEAKFPIAAISGSSGGAIAATVATCIPHRLDDYASTFIKNKGLGFDSLATMLGEGLGNAPSSSPSIMLSICLTRCRDGAPILKSFDSPLTDKNLLSTIMASCVIPPTFHPSDLFGKFPLSYPDGHFIDGEAYVDGGIAAPAPPVDDIYEKVIVSPISGGYNRASRISPRDTSFQFPFYQLRAREDFRIRPSMQNLRALRASSGMTSSYELKMYYDWGMKDGKEYLDTRKEMDADLIVT